MNAPDALHRVTWATFPCGFAAAGLGLFWVDPGGGLYARDTAFVAGAARGSDLLTLAVVAGGAWAMVHRGPAADAVLAAVHAWLLYLHAGNALGAVAFNEAFPLYVAAMPLSGWGLILAAQRVDGLRPPRGLAAFLAASGVVTAAVWVFLLVGEMVGGLSMAARSSGRTTYALDLGVVAPVCLAAAWAVHDGRAWAMRMAVPLLGLAALLLPMMAAQTAMQLRAGAVFDSGAVAPFLGFGVVSVLAIVFLRRAVRGSRRRMTY